MCCICAQTLWVDPYRELRTLRHDLTLDRGVSFEAALRRLEFERKARSPQSLPCIFHTQPPFLLHRWCTACLVTMRMSASVQQFVHGHCCRKAAR